MAKMLFTDVTTVYPDPITKQLLGESESRIQSAIRRIIRVTDDMTVDEIIRIVTDGGLTEEVLVSKPAVMEAVQKSIGRRPIGGAAMPNCPRCGCALPFPSSREYTFCQQCGQKIDWRD